MDIIQNLIFLASFGANQWSCPTEINFNRFSSISQQNFEIHIYYNNLKINKFLHFPKKSEAKRH
jgi:hypothetical protein